MNLNRRQWFKTTAGLLLAPAVVHSKSLMVIKPVSLVTPAYSNIEELIRLEAPLRARLLIGLMYSNSYVTHTLSQPKLRL